MTNTRFEIHGWFDGDDDCDPPEPGKQWLTIEEVSVLPNGETEPTQEICVFVVRNVDNGGSRDSAARQAAMLRAERIVALLNAAVAPAAYTMGAEWVRYEVQQMVDYDSENMTQATADAIKALPDSALVDALEDQIGDVFVETAHEVRALAIRDLARRVEADAEDQRIIRKFNDDE